MPSGMILIITRYYPIPAHDGALQYSSQIIRLFSRLAENVCVLCQSQRKHCNTSSVSHEEFPKNVKFRIGMSQHPSILDKIFTNFPHPAIPHGTGENVARLQATLKENFSWIVVDHIGSTWAVGVLQAYKLTHPTTRIIYCTHNMETDARISLLKASYNRLGVSLGSLIDIYRTRRTDRRMMLLSDIVTSITVNDDTRHRQVYGVRNGVIVEPMYKGRIVVNRKIDEDVPRRVCLVGSFESLAKKKNVLNFLRAATQSFTRMNIELFVVGRMDQALRDKLSSQWPTVTFTGEVAEVETYLASCRIGIIPEAAGGGFKLKSLDYVFNRVPIFALESAVVGLPLVPGVSIEIASSFRNLCRTIQRYIEDFDHLNAMQRSAFDACMRFTREDKQEHALKETIRNLSNTGTGLHR